MYFEVCAGHVRASNPAIAEGHDGSDTKMLTDFATGGLIAVLNQAGE